MFSNLKISHYCRLLGGIAIFISVFTWWIDLSGLVSACIFCRTERTVIGLLGIVMMLPHCRYITLLFATALAAMGLQTTSAHILLHLKQLSFTWLYTGMALSALFLMSGQLLVIIERAWITYNQRNTDQRPEHSNQV